MYDDAEVAAATEGADLVAATDGAVSQEACSGRGHPGGHPCQASGREAGIGGAGFLIVDRRGETLFSAALRAGRACTSYRAERTAIIAAARRLAEEVAALTDSAPRQDGRGPDARASWRPRIVVLTDSMSVIDKVSSADAYGPEDMEPLSVLNELGAVAQVHLRHAVPLRGDRTTYARLGLYCEKNDEKRKRIPVDTILYFFVLLLCQL